MMKTVQDLGKRTAMMKNLWQCIEQYEVFDELEEQFMDMEELVTAQIASMWIII